MTNAHWTRLDNRAYTAHMIVLRCTAEIKLNTELQLKKQSFLG